MAVRRRWGRGGATVDGAPALQMGLMVVVKNLSGGGGWEKKRKNRPVRPSLTRAVGANYIEAHAHERSAWLKATTARS